MSEDNREARVLEAVVTLVDSLLHDFDVVELLTDLTEQCAALLDVASAGLLLAGPRQRLHLMAATSESTEQVELFQLQADEGPCLDCFQTAAPVSIAGLAAERDRWPLFVPAALDAGFASVHAVPMLAAGSTLGALGLFGTSQGELDEHDLLVARSLAHVASVAIVQGRPPTPETVLPNLGSALAARVVVEQAKGYLREVLDVPVADAGRLLRRYARLHGLHVSELAAQLMSRPETRPALLERLRLLAEDAASGAAE